MKTHFLVLLAVGLLLSGAAPESKNKFINPFSEICWDCVLPIKVGGNVVFGKADLGSSEIKHFKTAPVKDSPLACFCDGSVGLGISFNDPAALVEVTPNPFSIVSLGIQLPYKDTGDLKGGSKSNNAKGAFYHFHYIRFPIFLLMNLLTKMKCLGDNKLDIGYLSEFDPTWMRPVWSMLVHPESFVFVEPHIAMAAGVAAIADCASLLISRKPLNLFFSAGCSGIVYPFTGFVEYHDRPIKTSLAIVQKGLAKLFRLSMLKSTSRDPCEERYVSFMPREELSIQLLRPSALTDKGSCQPLGATSDFWEEQEVLNTSAEETAFVLFKKRSCCLEVLGG